MSRHSPFVILSPAPHPHTPTPNYHRRCSPPPLGGEVPVGRRGSATREFGVSCGIIPYLSVAEPLSHFVTAPLDEVGNTSPMSQIEMVLSERQLNISHGLRAQPDTRGFVRLPTLSNLKDLLLVPMGMLTNKIRAFPFPLLPRTINCRKRCSAPLFFQGELSRSD